MKPQLNPLLSAAMAIAAAGTFTTASAAPLYWKTSAAGSWSGAFWGTIPGGPYTSAWTPGSDVIFEDNGGTALTITGATTNFASITANENVTVTASGTIATGGTVATINVANGKTLDFAGQAVSTAAGTGFIKNGLGTWSVAGGTYTGGFTLNAGTVAVGGVNAMGAGGTLSINGGIIRSNSATARNLTGKYTSITVGGDYTLGNATNNGALTFDAATGLGAATRTLTVNSPVALNGIISGGAGSGIIKTGSGVLTFGATNTYTGTTTISNGALSIAGTGALPGYNSNGSYSVASGATLAVYNAVTDANITTLLGTTNFAAGSALGFDTTTAIRTYAVALADTAQGSLGLTKLGGNSLTLSAVNTYSGGTTISHSDTSTIGIVAANAAALGTGSVLVNGAQNFNASLSVNANLIVTNDLTLKRGNGGSNRAILGLAASSTWSGAITVDNTNASGLAVIQANSAAAATASIVSGNIGFSTLGTGTTASPTLVLRGNNFFGKVSGSVALSTGYVQLLDASKWEFSNASNNWGTLEIANAGAIATIGAANTLSPGGVVMSAAAGTLQLNNQAGTSAYSQSIAGLSGNVKVGLTTGAATLTLNTTADQVSSGVISGAISLVKSGAATQTLTGANTCTGSTTINGGSLVLGTTGAISAADLTITSATLDLRKGTSTRLQSVANLTLNNATLELGLNASNDGLDVTGIASVSGTNTLKLHGSLATGTYNLISTPAPLTGTFILDTSGVTVSGFTSYTGGVDGSNYVLTVGGTPTPFLAYWHGDVSTVWSDSSAAPGSNWATDNTGTTDTQQLPGAVTDVVFSTPGAANTTTSLGADFNIYSLTFESGTATVGGTNNLTLLGTNINACALEVQSGATGTLNTGTTSATGTAAVQSGGTLTVNGGGLGSGPLLIDGALNLNMSVTHASLAGVGAISRTIAGTTVLTISGGSNSAFDGSISSGAGALALSKTGTSTLTLSGAASNFSGGTTISSSGDTAGIVVANASALGAGSVLVNGGQQFSASLAVNANLNVANALTLKRGNGGNGRSNLRLGDSSTWSGAITVDNTNASGYASIMAGGTTTATASIVSGNIGFSTLGTGNSANPTLALRSSNSFGKISGSIALSTGYVQLLDTTKWEFNNASNTWGTLEIANAGAIVTVGAANTLSPGGVVMSAAAGTLQLNNQAGTSAYSQSIAGLSGNVKVGLTTGAASLTLNTSANQASSGVISGAISLVKSGAAMQTLTGANTYTGNTAVNAGTLALAEDAQLKFVIGSTSGESNGISGAGTVTLDGDFNIDTTLADASALTTGTWTLENVTSLTGAYGASFQVLSGTTPWTATGDTWTRTVGAKSYTFDETTGVLTLSSGSGFDSWIASKGLTGPAAAFDSDPDNDGLDNGLEFVLGGEPNPANPGSNSTGLLPIVSQSSGNMTFSFKREDISESGVTLLFQWSTDLTFPSPASDIPVGVIDSTTDTVTVDVTEDAPDAETDTIVITVPAAKAAGGKLFGRLNAAKAP